MRRVCQFRHLGAGFEHFGTDRFFSSPSSDIPHVSGSRAYTILDHEQDLETIASLEFAKAIDRLAKEKQEKLRTALAHLQPGGPQLAAKREIELEYAEKSCSTLADIWVTLLEGSNGGILTRQHIDFIKVQVDGAASARRSALSSGPPMAANQQAVASYVAQQMEGVKARVGRDLELRLRRQEAGLPKGEPTKDGVNLTAHNAANIPRIIQGIKQLRKEVEGIRADLCQADRFTGVDEGLLNEKLKRWTNRVYEQLKAWGLKAEAEEGFGRNSIIDHYEGVDTRAKMRDDKLNALLEDVSSHPEHYEGRLAVSPHDTASKEKPKAQKVFLGHGNNKAWARVHMYLKDELHLDVEAWESSPRTGFHSVDVLKTVLDSCTFAVIVATGEDATVDGGLRARQNVVHEIGLFQGRLGFEKVALLQQRGVEEFSNLAGLQVILFSDLRVEEAFYELRRMLERERVIS